MQNENMKDNLFKLETIERIKKARKVFLWTAVWILIGELALGAILILTQSWDVSVGKIQGTFLILAAALFISVNNFIRMEKGDKKIQFFALISFISNMVWVVLATLLIWEALPFYWVEEVSERSSYISYMYDDYHMTFWSMMMSIAVCTAGAGFWISNIMSIKETIKIVKPLKITAIVCVVYEWIYGTIATIAELDYAGAPQLYQLSGLAGLAFLITVLAAYIISRTHDKDRKASSDDRIKHAKTDDELRAEIEEKVRREMIEKEVRAEFEKAEEQFKSGFGSEPNPEPNPELNPGANSESE